VKLIDLLYRAVASRSVDIMELMFNVSSILKCIGRNIIDDTIYVSDLTRCVLRAVYVRRLIHVHGIEKAREIILRKILDYDNINSILMGFIVQYGLERFLDGSTVRRSQITWRRVIDVDGIRLVISGKPDYEMIIDGRIIPVEVKFTRRSIEKPYSSYVTQCSIYAWLCNAPYCKLLIFTPERVIEREIGPATVEYLRLIVREWLSRAPLWEWECRHCLFRDMCRREDRERIRNSRSIRKSIKILHEIENQ